MKTNTAVALAVTVALFGSGTAHATVWFVSKEGSNASEGPGAGRSWPDAFRTIKRALDSATEGDVIAIGDGSFGGVSVTTDGLTLRGRGAERTFIRATSDVPGIAMPAMPYGTALVIEDIGFVGSETSLGEVGIDGYARDVTVRRCEFAASLDTGAFVSDGIIEASTFHSREGVHGAQGSHLEIVGSSFRGRLGIFFFEVGGFALDNTFLESDLWVGEGQEVHVEGNRFEESRISAAADSGLGIYNNIFLGGHSAPGSVHAHPQAIFGHWPSRSQIRHNTFWWVECVIVSADGFVDSNVIVSLPSTDTSSCVDDYVDRGNAIVDRRGVGLDGLLLSTDRDPAILGIDTQTFVPNADSVVVDAGVTSAMVQLDFAGVARDAHADYGAREYVAPAFVMAEPSAP